MILHPKARREYRVKIVTSPAVTSWEASFDDGETWQTGAPIVGMDDGYEWLVAGAESTLGDAVAVISSTLVPLGRATDDPEVLIEPMPTIHVSG